MVAGTKLKDVVGKDDLPLLETPNFLPPPMQAGRATIQFPCTSSLRFS